MVDRQIILITGGTGSLGTILIKKLLIKYPESVVRILSRDESKQEKLENELILHHGKEITEERVRFMLGDVRDKDRVDWAAKDCEIIYHLAALKIVPRLEYDCEEAILTNVIGTLNVTKAAKKNNVYKAMFISSDKSVSPTNLYGSTKHIGEKIWISQRYSSKVKFSVCRYGNVMGSRGSVYELFKNTSGPLALTDPKSTRFWWNLNQASDFVLKMTDIMNGGEIFIPKLSSCSLIDFVNAIFPEKETTLIGMRNGEKLHETMISEWESYKDCGDYYVSLGTGYSVPYTSLNAPKLTKEEILKIVNE